MGIGRCVMIPWILNEMEPLAKHVEYVCREARNFTFTNYSLDEFLRNFRDISRVCGYELEKGGAG